MPDYLQNVTRSKKFLPGLGNPAEQDLAVQTQQH